MLSLTLLETRESDRVSQWFVIEGSLVIEQRCATQNSKRAILNKMLLLLAACRPCCFFQINFLKVIVFLFSAQNEPEEFFL